MNLGNPIDFLVSCLKILPANLEPIKIQNVGKHNNYILINEIDERENYNKEK